MVVFIMYCVIQEIKNKTAPRQPTSKRIEVASSKMSFGSQEPYTKYYFSYSSEKFDRPIRKSYKISIHKSYREKGRVQKKQVSICTMGYYDLLDLWPGEYLNSVKLNEKITELDISEEQLWELVYIKLDPLIEKVTTEFQTTEEHAAKQEQRKTIEAYQSNKKQFESKYGESQYDRCYDVFGELKNKAYLEELEKSQEEQYKSSYQSYDNSNYDWSKYSSYSGSVSSTYTQEEKGLIEEIVSLGFRAVAKKYHPDINPNLENATELFQKLNDVKDRLLKIT